MDDTAAPDARSQTRAKSVQEHIDELPMWADGTRLKSAPMTGMQWLFWSLAAAGKFFEGFVVVMAAVALRRAPDPGQMSRAKTAIRSLITNMRSSRPGSRT